MNVLLSVGTLVAALGCGVVAGVFFAFSSFVIPALRRVSPAQGIVAMQSINVSAVTPAFMSLLFGTALVCLILVVLAMVAFTGELSGLVVGASTLYVFGAIGVTIVRNVPLNNKLAALNPDSPDAEAFWTTYVTAWTAWNHLRAAAALSASGMLIVALYV
jgi:uncharacterized membrane protein